MKVLIFGGTTEGRKLASLLSKAGNDVCLSVATEYGKGTAPDEGVTVLADRLQKEEIAALLKRGAYDLVVDATHPYAVSASRNISSVCLDAGTKFYRLIREAGAETQGLIYVPDAVSAANILKRSGEKALLTVGSKELEAFTGIEDFGDRLFVRILPMRESLEKALALGFHGPNIICMQGPFDEEMNAATLKKTGAKVLVTKDSGSPGGFEAKVAAALSLGLEVIVIARPEEEEGYTYKELLDVFEIEDIREEDPEYTAFFPLFVDMWGRKALVFGGGNIAERRVKTLVSFSADVLVISPSATEYISSSAARGELELASRGYEEGDIGRTGPFVVFAATDDRQVNKAIAEEAADLGIPVSVADKRGECTCYFPAIAENEDYTVGLVSNSGDHAGVKRLAERMRRLLDDE